MVLYPPPIDWAGGSSTVVPCTFTVQGGVDGVPLAAQVPGSFTFVIVTAGAERTRRSAVVPFGGGYVVMVVIGNRNRVTGAPVLFTTRRRIANVPVLELFAGSGVVSRTRFGAREVATVPSRTTIGKTELRTTGLPKFSGPGAPS